MHDQIARRLISLNHQFYEAFADSFSSTRQRLQPGVVVMLERIPATAKILDLGCGNGLLARVLAEGGFQGSYTGLDFSSQLLETARQNVPKSCPFIFIQADLSTIDWDADFVDETFDHILAFATLHHLPGNSIRQRLVHDLHAHLVGGGYLFHSNWQFLNSKRLHSRIQPWERAGIRADEVDPGDYLVDWRRGGEGLRYVHHFNQTELDKLAQNTGFIILDRFYSDGEGGKLGLYQAWQRLKNNSTPIYQSWLYNQTSQTGVYDNPT
jgi:SAM-dependent methyltransferase